MPISICIIGDIMLDVVTYLNTNDLTEVRDLKRVANTINVFAGGTGAMFALSAADEGLRKIHLIAKVGADPKFRDHPDIAALLAIEQLQKSQVDVLVALDPTCQTGVAMITYLRNGERILVADKGANGSFNKADISTIMRETVTSADVLFVSGYSLLEPEQAKATLYLMEEARHYERLVVLDVVPHSIYTIINNVAFRQLTKPVNVIISEVNTMKRLFFSGKESSPESDIPIIVVAQCLLENYEAVILRPDMMYQYVIDRSGIIEEGSTGFEAIKLSMHRGYSERLTAKLLLRYYDRFKAAILKH